MMDEAEVTKQVSPEMERIAAQRARDIAKAAMWNLDVAVFLFAVLILVIILGTYTEMGIEVAAPVAIFGLAMAWLVGWRNVKQLYSRFYDEELSKLGQELKTTVKEAVEETIEEKVQKALRERWQ
ncbi:unnamed protein product [marine sediment metagenome]|uniref:Uncharacterized protein n=1 Tax=marine sediment metagenome TaxID=412755 RepID=X1N7Z1_9ZZZZ